MTKISIKKFINDMQDNIHMNIGYAYNSCEYDYAKDLTKDDVKEVIEYLKNELNMLNTLYNIM